MLPPSLGLLDVADMLQDVHRCTLQDVSLHLHQSEQCIRHPPASCSTLDTRRCKTDFAPARQPSTSGWHISGWRMLTRILCTQKGNILVKQDRKTSWSWMSVPLAAHVTGSLPYIGRVPVESIYRMPLFNVPGKGALASGKAARGLADLHYQTLCLRGF
jgi:hypothetical protein